MIVQPTVNLGESFSKDRLATMIRDPPVLRGLVDNKSRYSGNTIRKKNFAGGQLTIVGANAPTDLRGRPIKVLLADEVDAIQIIRLFCRQPCGEPAGWDYIDLRLILCPGGAAIVVGASPRRIT